MWNKCNWSKLDPYGEDIKKTIISKYKFKGDIYYYTFYLPKYSQYCITSRKFIKEKTLIKYLADITLCSEYKNY